MSKLHFMLYPPRLPKRDCFRMLLYVQFLLLLEPFWICATHVRINKICNSSCSIVFHIWKIFYRDAIAVWQIANSKATRLVCFCLQSFDQQWHEFYSPFAADK